MPTPNLEFYDTTGALISNANPISLGLATKGIATPPHAVWLWNNKANASPVDTASVISITVLSSPDDGSFLFNGTELNGNTSMMEARSCRATGTPADAHKAWTKITPTSPLTLGPMPNNSSREIEIRLNVPPDAANHALASLSLKVNY